ncbi:MAG: DNA photolyase family protein [Candidatus Thiodiazotropha sp. (ex Monitilora ramsayi)]|nr:DNA photolyase family protein [Candidatus Thiodiazotropha sp. (ex Monitilora ramsayi)]
MTCAIVWFRRDLRLTDNPALATALQSCRTIIPLYIHHPDDKTPWQPGAASRWWLHHSLYNLSQALRQQSSRLVIERGEVNVVLRRLINKHNVTHLFWNRLYDPWIVERDHVIQQAFQSAGVHCQCFNASLLIEPWKITTRSDLPFRVFTPFWNRCQQLLASIDHPIPRPDALLPPPKGIASLTLESLGLLPAHTWDEGLTSIWHPGETGALNQLRRFLDTRLTQYITDREIPGRAGTSRLSPHLHFGEIGPRQILHALGAATMGSADHGNDSARGYLRELGWREFAHHLIYHFPETHHSPLNPNFHHFPWSWRDESAETLSAWQYGETGIPIVDAGMRELRHTGWMHNRVRMIVASLLTKNLGFHWLEGARWFWNTLVDANLANNTLGWQWTAGCGADAAPFFRIFNPIRQGKRFDPKGDYVRRWIPELATIPDKHVHAPWLVDKRLLINSGIELGKSYPQPIIDLKSSRQQALSHWHRIK